MTKQNTKFKEIADEYAMTTDTKKDFIKFMKLRFPNESDSSYIAEWAERFIYKRDWEAGDSKSRAILVKIGRRTKSGDLRRS